MTYQNIDPPRATRQELTITVHATIDGFPTEVCFSGSIDQLLGVTKRLRGLGATPTIAPVAPAPSGGNTPARKGAAMITEPAYDGSGQAMCPVHRKALSEGRYGLYCPSRAEGEHANPKGYCNIRFTD